MKKYIALGALLTSISNLASATLIVDQVGDVDGFGIGALNGESFNWQDVGSGDGDGTDRWLLQDTTISHTYDISGLTNITSASLELFTGGQGWYGLTSIYLDGAFVGHLTDGDDVGPGYNYAWLDTFDLLPFAAQLDGANELTIDVYNEGGDGWVLDYSRLTISGEVASVPEPGTFALLFSGLMGIGFSYKRKRISNQ